MPGHIGHMLSLNLTFWNHFPLLELVVSFKVVFPYCAYNYTDTNRGLKTTQVSRGEGNLEEKNEEETVITVIIRYIVRNLE